jgi:hypothetical protein
MTRERHRHPSSSLVRLIVSIAAVVITAAISAPVRAQSSDWRVVDNPYQEDIEYSLGDTHTPRVEVEGIRWRSFKIEGPDTTLLEDGEEAEIEVTLEFENRRNKSARILAILLLEDADGNPLERIEAKQFKLTGGRLKERKETARIPATNLKAVERVYVFFEVTN